MEPTQYHPEAISRFIKQNYVSSLNGHQTDFASANTLRNSTVQAINMDGMFDRFKPELKGGHFANTYWNKSTFEKKVSICIDFLLTIPLLFQ